MSDAASTSSAARTRARCRRPRSGPEASNVPELPEVETIRRRLEPALGGRRIERAIISDARLTRPEPPGVVAEAIVGERVAALLRRGKYLVVDFDGPAQLVVHLRMSGSFALTPSDADGDPSHSRATLTLDDGARVVYRDVRRFGTWLLADRAKVERYLEQRLGPEPLERSFTREWLARSLHGRSAPIKAILLDQQVAAGLGNIYADEALWRAQLGPLRPAGSLDEAEVAALRRGIRAALRRGIVRQGATLRDYRDPDGRVGGMQDEFAVYGRGGEPCLRCASPIAKTRVAGRGTWYCTACQGRGR